MIMPYGPLAAAMPTDILSYYVSVDVADFVASATSLESTSLVLAFGLDLFFVPVRASRAYDILGDGFNYTVLYSTLAISLTLWAVTHRLLRNKQLRDRWK